MAAPTNQPDLVARARDAFYTAVGFGVLGVQRLQVGRRDLASDVSERVAQPESDLGRLVRQVQEVVDPVLDVVEMRLPPAGRLVVRRARRAAQGSAGSARRR